MKKILSISFFLWHVCFNCYAQKYWTGGGAAGQWNDGANWTGGTVPASSDHVILDNSNVSGTYTVTLPNIATTILINTLQINPAGVNTITLIIPTGNTANPGLSITGPGDALIINANGILQNSTGAPIGGIGMNITNTFRINHNGRYIHNNVRANAPIVSQLSSVSGTEKGIFEYDVPGNLQYAISLSNRTYGTLQLSSLAAGGNKTYTGNGGSDLGINGNLIINSGANFNSSMTANINIAADLTINGNFDNSPSSGATGRSINLNGTTNQTISGVGTFSTGVNFRNIKINENAIVTLARNFSLNSNDVNDSLIVDTSAILKMGAYIIAGAGKFKNFPLSYLSIGDANGITIASNPSGNVQTGTRIFDTLANYEYNGTTAQVTGSALPFKMAQLNINNSSGVTLSSQAVITDSLSLTAGKLFSGTVNSIILTTAATVHSGAGSYFNLTPAYPVNIGTANSYIVGPIKKIGLAGQTFAFPVGNFLHRPVILKNATGNFEVNYVEQNPYYNITNGGVMDGVLNHVSHIEYWTINSPNGTATVELTFYDPNSGGVTQMSTLRVAQHDGAKWNDKGNTSTLGTPGSNGSVTGNTLISINTLSPFTLASTVSNENPLPVYLKYFQLRSQASDHYIEWGIENDYDYKSYILERSFDGIIFNEINNQFSRSANSLTWYNYKDKVTATCFYRLKLTTNTGKVFYSNTLKATGNFYFTIQPNPANKEIIVNVPATSSISTIDIVNSTGQIVKHLQTTSTSTTVNIESLSKGMYFIRFRNQQQAISQRFIKE